MKSISVIVPVYKIKESYLRYCLDSLLCQASDQFKVILVDDGSPDNCGEICDEYARKSDIFMVIHQENAGVSAARNAGMAAADTEWITFADPDDWLDGNAIERELYAIGRAQNADIIMFDYSREYANRSQAESLNIHSGMIDGALIEACRQAPFYKLIVGEKVNPYSINAVWNKLYRRDFIRSNAIRFVPEARKGQDRLFNAMAFNCTKQYYYLNEHLYNYRCSEASVSNSYNKNIVKLTLIEIAELQRVINKYQLQVQHLFNARICTRLYSCMRLYCFHPSNPEPSREKMRTFKALTAEEPFYSSVRTVNMKLLSPSEKFFVCCLKYRMFGLCKVLVYLKSSRFGKKLSV